MSLTVDAHLPLLSSAEVGGGRPTVVARRDGTFLAAYGTNLWHVSGDGAILTRRDIPWDGGAYLAPTSNATDLYLTGGFAYVLDGTNITATRPDPTPPPVPNVLQHNVSPFVMGDLTVIVTRTGVHTYTVDGSKVGLWPMPGAPNYPQAAWPNGTGGLTVLMLNGTVWDVAAGGATQTGAVTLPELNTTMGGTDPTVTPSVAVTAGPHWGAHLIADGVVVAADGQDDLDRVALGMSAPTAQGGVAVTQWTNYDFSQGGYAPAFDLVHYFTPRGELHTARLAPGKMAGVTDTGPALSHHARRVAVVDLFVDDNDNRNLHLWLLTVPGGRHAALRVGVVHGDGHSWSSRLVGDESWEHGPGRMKVADVRSPSGWSMEVKPGDDTADARWIRLDLADGKVAAFRVVPWTGG